MSGSLNKAIIMGNLGADPDVRTMQDGRPVVTLSIATTERWKDRSTGDKRERTEWHRVVCFNEGICNVIQQYLRKGSSVYIEGKIQTRSYEQNGVKKYATEIVMNGYEAKLLMLDSASSSRPPPAGSQDSYGQGDSYDSQQSPSSHSDNNSDRGFGNEDHGAHDDDIPF